MRSTVFEHEVTVHEPVEVKLFCSTVCQTDSRMETSGDNLPETSGRGELPPTQIPDPKEPPTKMVRLEDLESSIEKIVERSLLKAAQGQTNPPANVRTTSTSTTGKEGPPPYKRRVLPGVAYSTGMTNTLVFARSETNMAGGRERA